MFKTLTPLKFADHADLRFQVDLGYAFAREELVAPIVIDEIADVSREYPIIFPSGGTLPVALLGVQQGSNAYVSPNGTWRATYIPAHIRHYPLAITRLPSVSKEEGVAAESDARYVVLIDVDAPLLSKLDGVPVFNDDGTLSVVAQEKTQILNTMQMQASITQTLVRAIEVAGILVERTIRIKVDGERDRQVTGLRVIDEAALNALDDATFNKLRTSGALPLVFSALLSWANFRQGPIGKSHTLPEVEAEASKVDALVNFD
ncbi:MAG: SapC family protein [Yoonia sp.]